MRENLKNGVDYPKRLGMFAVVNCSPLDQPQGLLRGSFLEGRR